MVRNIQEHFYIAWSRTLGHEGRYSNDPDDPGKETMWGITIGLARHYKYLGPMADMPVETARVIAKVEFWDKLRLDYIANLCPKLAYEMFDTAYNMNHAAAGKFLQEWLNAFDDAGLTVDGKVGDKTLQALCYFLNRRGVEEGGEVLYKALNCSQGARYKDLIHANPKLRKFGYGWMKNRVSL